MFLVEFLRFLSGYIRFTGSGGFSERFINLCSIRDIPLWDVACYDDHFDARTTIAGYLQIAECARNSGVRIKRTQSVGVPFILKKLRPRYGLLIGFFIFAISFTVLSERVWMVHISGNDEVPTDTILAATQQSGLQIGMDCSDINAVQLSLETGSKLKNVAWVSVTVRGCCVYIDIKEAPSTPKIESRDGFYNLVASKDAQLIMLECYRGTAQAKVLNPVLKGEVLISGTTDNVDETTSFVRASGYAVGLTNTRLSASTPQQLTTVRSSLVKKVYTVNFFGITIPLGKPPEKYSQKFTKKSSISFDEKILPISVITNEFYSFSKKHINVDRKTSDLISLNKFMNSAAYFSRGKQILKADITPVLKDDCSEYEGNFICYENIGMLSPLETEQE